MISHSAKRNLSPRWNWVGCWEVEAVVRACRLVHATRLFLLNAVASECVFGEFKSNYESSFATFAKRSTYTGTRSASGSWASCTSPWCWWPCNRSTCSCNACSTFRRKHFHDGWTPKGRVQVEIINLRARETKNSVLRKNFFLLIDSLL